MKIGSIAIEKFVELTRGNRMYASIKKHNKSSIKIFEKHFKMIDETDETYTYCLDSKIY